MQANLRREVKKVKSMNWTQALIMKKASLFGCKRRLMSSLKLRLEKLLRFQAQESQILLDQKELIREPAVRTHEAEIRNLQNLSRENFLMMQDQLEEIHRSQ